MKQFNLGVITHIVANLPENEISLIDVAGEIPISKIEAKKIIKTTGFSHVREVQDKTSKDLCLSAAQKLLSQLSIDEIEEIDVILFVSQTRDYIMPQTSAIIQHELGLKNNIVCKDIPLGCSGYTYGLMEAFMFLNSGMKSVLLLAGETNTKVIGHKDKSVRMVFGDGGTATLIKSIKNSLPVFFDYGTDGEGHKDLIIKSGAMRFPSSAESKRLIEFEDGITRSDEDMFMNGLSIMSFAIKRVPKSIKNLSEKVNCEINRFYFHQANKFMLDYLVKKTNLDSSKVPFNANKIGNTGPASIPTSICVDLKNGVYPSCAILSGFGVGFSWASCNVDLSQIKYTSINI